MSLLSRLFGQRQQVSGLYDNGGTTVAPAEWLINYIGNGIGGKTVAGEPVTEQSAEGIPAIYACIRVLSETVGQLPLKLMRMTSDGKGRKPDTDHPLYIVLHDLFNDNLTAYQGREMMTRWLAQWGRSYAFIQRDRRGDIKGLFPMHPMRMFTSYNSLNQKVFKYYMGRGEYKEWVHNPDKPDILHLHINCDDGLDGRSPLTINRESLGITLAAEKYVGAYFGNGALPGFVLSHPGRLKEGAKENLRRQWLEKFMGASKSNKMAILEEGIAITVVDNHPEKAQLDKLRAAQIEAAARIYRVPLFLIQNQTKDTSWGSGIEQQMLGFVNLTMMPWFQQWQQVVKRDLLNRQSFYTHDPVFIVNSLVRGDLKARVEAYASARQNGWLNGDEIRELEDMNPMDEGAGKLFWQPSNMLPVVGGMPVAIESPEPEPKAEPEPEPKAIAKGSEAVN
jgi:HK97 family phage portal protein